MMRSFCCYFGKVGRKATASSLGGRGTYGLPYRFSDRWYCSPLGASVGSLPKFKTVHELLEGCDLGRFAVELERYNLQELKHLMANDKDTLYDILIDASMKTDDRQVFLKALREEAIAVSETPRYQRPATRSKTSYMLSPSFFQGQWSLDRSISGRVVQTAKGYGLASFCQEGYESEVSAGFGTKKWLRYEESGEQILSPDPPHRLESQTVAFTMTYLYQHSLLQDRLDIFFDRQRGDGPHDEDLFCSFDLVSAELGVPLVSTTHLCGRDSYEGEFILSDINTWSLRYSVNGPSKSFAVETRYRRLADLAE